MLCYRTACQLPWCLHASCLAQEFVERLHNSSRRFVPILDPGIPVLPGYKPYDEGIDRDIFIRDVTGQPYIGEVSLHNKPAA